MKGSTYKRCACGTTGTPGKPACKKAHGTWWWRAEGSRDPETGKRRQPSQGGYRTKDEALEGLAEYQNARARGTWADDRGMTVGQWFDRWLSEGTWETLTRTTYEGHLATVWRSRIGHLRLRDLRRWHVDEALRESATAGDRPTRAARTLRSYQATLRASLTAAVEAGLLSVNVAAGNFKSIPVARKPELRVWQPDELATFLAAVDDDPLISLWRLIAFTGERRGEALGLRWADVELDGKHPAVTIRQTVLAKAGANPCRVCDGTHRGGFIKPSPKSDAGARWVPLVAEAIDALRVQRVRQDAERALWGEAYSDHGLVFAQVDGSPLNPSAVTHRFGSLIAAVNAGRQPADALPKIRPHDMRHGAASMMIAAGVPIETVSLIIGHSSTATTRQVYLHSLRGPAAAAMEAAAALVRGDGGAQSVHTDPSSSEPGEVIDPQSRRSEARDADSTGDRHCMTNPGDVLPDGDVG